MHFRTLLLPALFALGLPSSPQAAVMSLESSELSFSIGASAPSTVIPQSPGSVAVAVSSGTGSFSVPAGLFAGTAILPTQIFFTVPLISSLNMTVTNDTIAVAGGAGSGVLPGFGKFGACGGIINLFIPLDVGGGGTATGGAAALQISVTLANGWTTGVATVDGITTTTPSGVVNTASLTGFDARTAAHAGTILLVTPARLLSTGSSLPLFATLRLTFVPEPHVVLLLAAAAGGVAIVGRSRR